MKIFRVLLAISFFSTVVFANITVNEEYILNHADYAHSKIRAGSLLNKTKGTLVAKYNFATQGGKSTADIDLLTDNKDLKTTAKLPAKAVITNAWIQMLTQPTATDSAAATVAIRVDGAADIYAATLVSTLTGSYYQAIPTGATTTFVRLNYTNDSTVKIRVATQSLTAGKFNVILEYVIGD